MASERQCGVWARGSGCVEVKGHKGPHVSECQALLAERDAEIKALVKAGGLLAACLEPRSWFPGMTGAHVRSGQHNEALAKWRAALAARGGAAKETTLR